MTLAIRDAGAEATLKWPNDVRIGGLKVCGILSELLPDLSGAVLGLGVNLTADRSELPVDTATSLRLAGARDDADELLAAFLPALGSRIEALADADGNADRSGARAEVGALCESVGRSVRVILPDGNTVVGEATGIDSDGRLQVARPGRLDLAVAAGEVTHLRY